MNDCKAQVHELLFRSLVTEDAYFWDLMPHPLIDEERVEQSLLAPLMLYLKAASEMVYVELFLPNLY